MAVDFGEALVFCAPETCQRQHGLLAPEPPGTQPYSGDQAPLGGRDSWAGSLRSPHGAPRATAPQCMWHPHPAPGAQLQSALRVPGQTPQGLPLPRDRVQQAQLRREGSSHFWISSPKMASLPGPLEECVSGELPSRRGPGRRL